MPRSTADALTGRQDEDKTTTPCSLHRERIYLYNVQAFVLPVRIVVLCSQDMENGEDGKKRKMNKMTVAHFTFPTSRGYIYERRSYNGPNFNLKRQRI